MIQIRRTAEDDSFEVVVREGTGESFAIGPGGVFIFEEEAPATFLPQRQGASAKVVLACAQK